MIVSAPPSRNHSASAQAAHGRRDGSGAPSAAAFLDALFPATSGDDVVSGERQDTAEDGKPLPDAAGSPLDWLATLAPPTLMPPPLMPPQIIAAPIIATPVLTADIFDGGAAAPIALPPAATPALTAALTGEEAATTPTPPGDVGIFTPSAPGLLAFARDPALAHVRGPVVIELPAEAREAGFVRPAPALAPMMPFAPAPAGTAAPAGQIFAAALHASTREKASAEPIATGHDAAALPGVATTGTDLAPHAVTASADAASGGALDMRDGRWPHGMLDRIERMRDDANAADTRIRLVPDALGSIDVNLRRDGDTLHVRFHAAQAETRALLADAQPRLAELASQRGMTLGDSQVGGGNAQGDRQPPRPAPATAPRPASAPAAEVEASETLSTHRIA